MVGAAAMSLSSICVVSNALRLNFVRLDGNINKLEENEMFGRKNDGLTVEIKIDGMMCPHCEGRVKKALEALEQVKEAAVSHKKGNAVITLNTETDVQILKNTVEEAGYTVK